MNKLPIDVRGLDVRLPQDLKDWRPAFPEPQEPTPTAPIGERKARIAVVAALCAVVAGWLAVPPAVEQQIVEQPQAMRTDCSSTGPGKMYRQVLYDDANRPVMTQCFRVRAASYATPRLEVR